MKKFFLALVAMTALTVGSAVAAPITGTIGFGNNLNNGILASATITNGTATSITFFVGPTVGNVTLAGGTFGLISGTNVDFTPGPPYTLSEANIGSAGTLFNFGTNFSFVATSFAGSNLVSKNGTDYSIKLTGTYKSTIPGLDDTNGILNFTFQDPTSSIIVSALPAAEQNTTRVVDLYSYSASGSTVPEPSTYALLGTALLGLGLLRRRK